MIKGGDFIGLKFIDLFAGIGGFRLGMEKHGHKCVGWCEKDKFAQKSYRSIHDTKGEWFADDITDVQPRELPEADVYCGGFPCQSFSIAGERGGFDDIRGTLIFEVLRLAKERQPKYLFLENVRGLLSHDGGKTFATILNSLHDVGYEYVEWQVLNSKDFGVPQNRERVFIIGHFRKASTRKIFPIRRKNSKTIKRHQIDSSGKGYNSQNDRLYETDGVMCFLPKKQTASKTKIIQVGNYKSAESSIDNPETGRVYSDKGISPCLNSMQGGDREPKIFKNMQIRKLTPKECWRLQGFPDWAYEKAAEVNSDTQLYKQAGNSVTVNVIEEIAKRLKKVDEAI